MTTQNMTHPFPTGQASSLTQRDLPSQVIPAYASAVAETKARGFDSPNSQALNSRAASRHARGFLLGATLWHGLSMGGPSGEGFGPAGPVTGLSTPLGSARPIDRGLADFTPSSQEAIMVKRIATPISGNLTPRHTFAFVMISSGRAA